MTLARKLPLACLTLLGAAFAVAAGQQQGLAHSPVGRWTTFDDHDGTPTAVVEIRRSGDFYVGIVREILTPATHDDSLCLKCTDERRGKPIIGMEIVRHMKADVDGDEWSGGDILDPETGKVYRARMHLADDGRKLVVRGYLGIPMLGRSQTWLRRADVPSPGRY